MNKMFNFNGMPYKRSGRAGGKSVSMIGMLVLLLAALLVLPSCDDETEVPGPTVYVCPDGSEEASAAECPAAPTPMPEDMYDDTGVTEFNGGDLDEFIAGSEGNDTLNGNGGEDTLNGMGGNDTITGGDGGDTLLGGDGNDTIDGGPGVDTINGGPGDDMLTGGLGADDIDGGEGTDTASYALSGEGVQIDLSEPEDIASHGDAFRDTLRNIEVIEGSAMDDRLTGNDDPNTLKGGEGDDMLAGGAGDDTLAGGAGDDTLDGGAGNDTADYSASTAGVTVDLSQELPIETDGEGTDTIATYDHDGDGEEAADVSAQISTIENVKGSAAAVTNSLTGNDEDNRLYGGAGNDNLTGKGGDDTLVGNAGVDTLTGNGGGDTLNGGAGDDTLTGGDGDDTYVAVTAGDMVMEETADDSTTMDMHEGGMDTVHYVGVADDPETEDTDETKGVTDDTPNNVETVLGTQNDDTLTAADSGVTVLGLEGDDTLNGGAGDDTLVGCKGTNTLNGGAGSDVFGVFNDGANADTIEDFNEGDEIHLKGFDAGAVTFAAIADNVTHAAVQVGGVTVAMVTSSTIMEVMDVMETDEDETKSKVEAIIDALEDDNADDDPVTRLVTFPVEKCSSN